MTVEAAVVSATFSCNGALTQFDFTFGLGVTADLEVIHTDADGVQTVLTETTDYSLSATNDDYSTGGRVTTVATYDSGETITLRLAISLTQASDFTENQATLYETFEDGLDKLTRIAQQLDEAIGRCLSFTRSSGESGEEVVPVPSALKFLRWDSTGAILENADLTSNLADLSAHEADQNAHGAGKQSVTISSGEIDGALLTGKCWLEVSPEAGDSDDLTGITGYAAGDEVKLSAASGKTISVLSGANLKLPANFSLSGYKKLVLHNEGGDVWSEVSRAAGS